MENISALAISPEEETALSPPWSPPPIPFGDWLKATIKARGMLQREFATALIVDEKTLTFYISGRRRVSKQNGPLIMALLGIPPAALPQFMAWAYAYHQAKAPSFVRSPADADMPDSAVSPLPDSLLLPSGGTALTAAHLSTLATEFIVRLQPSIDALFAPGPEATARPLTPDGVLEILLPQIDSLLTELCDRQLGWSSALRQQLRTALLEEWRGAFAGVGTVAPFTPTDLEDVLAGLADRFGAVAWQIQQASASAYRARLQGDAGWGWVMLAGGAILLQSFLTQLWSLRTPPGSPDWVAIVTLVVPVLMAIIPFVFIYRGGKRLIRYWELRMSRSAALMQLIGALGGLMVAPYFLWALVLLILPPGLHS